MSGQEAFDLFGQQAARDAWAATFERVEWVAPWDCGIGPAGTVILGWRCPDPDCRRVEPNAGLIQVNHGFDPDVPNRRPWGGRCARLTLLASQARAAAERASR